MVQSDTLHPHTLNGAVLVTVFVIDVCMLIFLKLAVKVCLQFFHCEANSHYFIKAEINFKLLLSIFDIQI